MEWRVINDYGITIDYRTYDSPDLNPHRRRDSGLPGKRGLWEVHYDPYDVSRIWVRDQRGDEWIAVPWTHLPMVRARSAAGGRRWSPPSTTRSACAGTMRAACCSTTSIFTNAPAE